MISKNKLEKMAAVTEKYIKILSAPNSPVQESGLHPAIYESGLGLLVKTAKLQRTTDKQQRIASIKMVKSAKNLSIDFQQVAIGAFSDFSEHVLDKIERLNGFSKLAPLKKEVQHVIESGLKALETRFASFYYTLLLDIFNSGRQHQELFVKSNNVRESLKKYAAFNESDTQNYEKLYHDNLQGCERSFQALHGNLMTILQKCYTENNLKFAIINKLQKELVQFSFSIEDMLRQDAWKTYSYGNLHQLAKDKVKLVTWKTGHHIDDCVKCRAYETGDTVLTKEGIIVPHQRTVDKIMYDLKSIMSLSNFDGVESFGHYDCRCSFIPVK